MSSASVFLNFAAADCAATFAFSFLLLVSIAATVVAVAFDDVDDVDDVDDDNENVDDDVSPILR